MLDNKKKKSGKGLGKGLDALMRSGAQAETKGVAEKQTHVGMDDPYAGRHVPGERILLLDPTAIQPNPKQPRRVFDEERLSELADSILKDGVQEPLIVRRVDGEYQIVCGERRCRAAVMAGLETVPAICRNVADGDMLKFGLIENIQREDLNAIELARAYKELMEQYNWTQEQLSDEVGKKRATVANTLRLLQLPELIQGQVADGALTMGHARAVAAVSGAERQLALSRRIVENGLSVRQAEQLASKEAEKQAPRKKTAPPEKDPHIAELENQLRRRLGAKVAVRHMDGNKGKIEIEYYSLAELDRILEIISNR